MGQTYRSISPSAMIENIIALRAQESVGLQPSIVWLESGRFRLVRYRQFLAFLMCEDDEERQEYLEYLNSLNSNKF